MPGTTWASYRHFPLVLPILKSVLEFIGAVQRRPKKGDCGQTYTQIRAFLLKRSFSLPVVLTYVTFVLDHMTRDRTCFLTIKTLTC